MRCPEGAGRATSPWLTCYTVPKPPCTSHGTWGQSRASLFLSFPLCIGLESSEEQKTSRGQQRQEVVSPGGFSLLAYSQGPQGQLHGHRALETPMRTWRRGYRAPTAAEFQDDCMADQSRNLIRKLYSANFKLQAF